MFYGMGLSNTMLRWMEACDEYRTEYKRLYESRTYDIDYILTHERERMEAAEREYLDALREALGLEVEDEDDS